MELARLIATNAPLAVQAALASAARASRDAAAQVLGSRDAAEGVSAFVDRRAPMFEGR